MGANGPEGGWSPTPGGGVDGGLKPPTVRRRARAQRLRALGAVQRRGFGRVVFVGRDLGRGPREWPGVFHAPPRLPQRLARTQHNRRALRCPSALA